MPMDGDPTFDVTVAIPVKPFDAAKQRLSDVLSPADRADLSRRLAAHTARAAADAGAQTLILSADHDVTAWATRLGLDVLLDEGSSLDQAARSAARWASERGAGWLICHADLPLLTGRDLEPLVGAVRAGGPAIAPSSDGGTSAIGWRGTDFRFSYGPGSFHRHLAALGGSHPTVVTKVGLLLDLDRPEDLRAATRLPEGRWLTEVSDPGTV